MNGLTIATANGKPSIPLFAKVLRQFDIPTLVLCDADPGKPTGPDLTNKITQVVEAANVVLADPDLDTVCDTRAKTGKYKLEPTPAQAFFNQHYKTYASLPAALKSIVEKAKALLAPAEEEEDIPF